MKNLQDTPPEKPRAVRSESAAGRGNAVNKSLALQKD